MARRDRTEYLKIYYKEHKGKLARDWSYTDDLCHKKLKDMTPDERREYFRLAKKRSREKRKNKADQA